MAKLLTKSKFLNGLQCDRLLWVVFNQPEILPETDIVSQYVFDQGHAVDELAKKLYPDGIDLTSDSFIGNIRQTKYCLSEGVPLFQAGLRADNLYSRVDVLIPEGWGNWEIVEVKSSTEVKPEHLPDVAFQRHCCRKASLPVTRCGITHVNNQYVRRGELNLKELLVNEDVTALADDAAIGLDDTISHMKNVIVLPEFPASRLSPDCQDPRDCALIDQCHSRLPDHHVLTLVRGKKAGYELLSQGVECIKDIPADFRLTASQKIQRACVVSGIPHVDLSAIQTFLAEMKYPLAYFDFETINPAIPLYDGTRPYQRIPFQFSLDVVPGEGAGPQHFSFLAKSATDPRPGLIAKLKKWMPDQGGIVVYNKTFEAGILKELGEIFPSAQEWLTGLQSLLLDLHDPFKKFHYYHPDQEGSTSIKHVLPALTGKGYEEMDIAAGDVASVLYWNVTHKPAAEAERQKVYSDLEKYCGLDTDGMRSIVDQLKRF